MQTQILLFLCPSRCASRTNCFSVLAPDHNKRTSKLQKYFSGSWFSFLQIICICAFQINFKTIFLYFIIMNKSTLVWSKRDAWNNHSWCECTLNASAVWWVDMDVWMNTLKPQREALGVTREKSLIWKIELKPIIHSTATFQCVGTINERNLWLKNVFSFSQFEEKFEERRRHYCRFIPTQSSNTPAEINRLQETTMIILFM